MKTRIDVVICFSVLTCFSLKAISQNSLTLKQCIETGIANNLVVQQSDLQAQSDKATWKQSRLNILPDLNASAGQSFNQGRSIDPYTNSPVTQSFNSSNYGVSSNVILFNGFAIQNSIKQSALNSRASQMEWEQQKDNLAINITLAYLQVLSASEQLEQAKNRAQLSGKQVERLLAMNSEGAIRPSDLSDMKGQHAGDQFAIVNAINTLESAKLNLCNLMNVPYDKTMVLEKMDPVDFTAAYDGDPSSIYQNALEQLPIIQAVELREQSAGKGVKVARGQLFPVLSFGGSLSTSYSSLAFQSKYQNTVYTPTSDSVLINNTKYPVYKFRDNFSDPSRISYKDQLDNNLYTSIGFNLRIPIFNSLSQRNRIKQARIRLKNAELVASNSKTQLSRDIEQAYLNMTTAADRYKVLLDQVNAYNESFRSAGILFEKGVDNSVDYLVAKTNYDQSNLNLVIAKYDYILRKSILDYYQGRKTW